MNDGRSSTRMHVFFSALPTAKAVASVASSVRSPGMISSSGMTATGLKKWKPTTRSGCSSVEAISVIDRLERVRREHALGRHDGLDLGEDLLLDRHLLEDRLDDEVGVGEAVLARRPGDEGLVAVQLVGAQPALARELVELGVDVADALGDALLVDVGQHDRHLRGAG